MKTSRPRGIPPVGLNDGFILLILAALKPTDTDKELKAEEFIDEYPLLLANSEDMRPSIHDPAPENLSLFEKLIGFRVKTYFSQRAMR
jgi:hypothetical protein